MAVEWGAVQVLVGEAQMTLLTWRVGGSQRSHGMEASLPMSDTPAPPQPD